MPLTPSGRQLRTVLAGLRDITRGGSSSTSSPARTIINRTTTTQIPPTTSNRSRPYHHGGVQQYSTASALAKVEESASERAASVSLHEDGPAPRTSSRTRRTRGWRVKYRRMRRGFPGMALQPPHLAIDASTPDIKSQPLPQTGLQGDEPELKSHAPPNLAQKQKALCQTRADDTSTASTPISIDDDAASGEGVAKPAQFGKDASDALRPHATMPQLEGILFSFLQGPPAVEKDCSFHPTSEQAEVLESAGYSEGDVQEWAKILTTPNSFDAVTLLARRTNAWGPRSTPLFVLLHLLRREYISARALRTLVKQTEGNLQARTRKKQNMDKPLYLAFRNMLRHARKVWPGALTRITQLFLANLAPLEIENSLPDPDQLRRLTNTLNKALRSIVVPTAIEPMKNNVHQEAALVQVLQFMTDHNPTLQIEREGYRAVILLQLAQKKTRKEQQWAELKALSWPPWKEERTAMDRLITADVHGVSKAAATLLRMREAGYGPLGWEHTAMVYSGWDTDHTPTIQTLSLLGAKGSRFDTGTATWASRIVATRTAQEAWAAFLAYEDHLREKKMVSPDQEAHLALLHKLHKEDVRRSSTSADKSSTAASEPADALFDPWPLFPGDVKEVSPLPPSAHLHTYTRSETPTMAEFYDHMQRCGIMPQVYCLAFLVSHADNLRLGFKYIKESAYGQDVIGSLFNLNRECDITKVPLPIYTAFIQLLCRFSKVPMSVPVQHVDTPDLHFRKSTHVETSGKFTKHTALAHAIALLRWLHPLHPLPYNAVLQCLAHTSSHQNIRTVEIGHKSDAPMYWKEISKRTDAEQGREEDRGAVTAYKLGRRVLLMMRERHLELDIDGFHAYCQIMENTALASWHILQGEEGEEAHSQRPRPHFLEAFDWTRSTSHASTLKGAFRLLVGDDSEVDGAKRADLAAGEVVEDDTPLEIPSFSLLHMYVRALGWMADYDGLLQTVRWMHIHATELETRQKQDRNRGVLMHRTLCALRVFLERSWLTAVTSQQEHAEDESSVSEEQGMESHPRPRLAKQLRRLRSPAQRQVVDEVRSLVDSVEYWGGWPSDEDVERYYRASKRFERAV